jgi:fatty-acyl-CoA synthase
VLAKRCWLPAGRRSARRKSNQHAASKALSRYDVPERIVFVEALPKTSVGKLNKKMLREQYAQKRVKNSTKFLLFAAK